jgi:hypothetical protein
MSEDVDAAEGAERILRAVTGTETDYEAMCAIFERLNAGEPQVPDPWVVVSLEDAERLEQAGVEVRYKAVLETKDGLLLPEAPQSQYVAERTHAFLNVVAITKADQ